MNNRDRAIHILNQHWSVAQESGQADEAECCVQALADDDLLMPDPPFGIPGIGEDGEEIVFGSAVTRLVLHDVWDEKAQQSYQPDEAINHARCLMAAATFAKRNQEMNSEITPDMIQGLLAKDDKELRAGLEALLQPQSGLLGKWATHPKHGRVLIMSDRPIDDKVWFAYLEPQEYDGTNTELVRLSDLTVDESHPKVLVTETDYADVPTGTVVAEVGGAPWVKNYEGLWQCAINECFYKNEEMSHLKRMVLRRGWDNESA